MNTATIEALTKSKTRNRDYPVVLIVGPTGSGKTRSVVNMPPAETAIINIENKPLSFIGSEKFEYKFNTTSEPGNINAIIKTCLDEPTFKYLFIDSFTMFAKYLYEQAQTIKKGFDIYSYFNQEIFRFLESLKTTNKMVFLTAVDELVEEILPTGSKVSKRRCSVFGKQWEGQIETQFTYVLFTDIKKVNDKMSYSFITNTDGYSSAKTPEGMFPATIANDCWEVTKVIEKKLNLNQGVK